MLKIAEIEPDGVNSRETIGHRKVSTLAVGEEGDSGAIGKKTTHALGEEGEASIAIYPESGEDKVSTLSVGEEGHDPRFSPSPITIDPINGTYNRLLELAKKILKRVGNNTGVGIGFPPIIDLTIDPKEVEKFRPKPIENYYPNPIVGRDYTNSMPRIIDSASVRIEHAYLPEAE